MYKYNIFIDDWHRLLSYLVRKVYLYDDFLVIIDNKCIANDIINLCRQRDNLFHCANNYSFLFKHKWYTKIILYRLIKHCYASIVVSID